MSRYLIPIVLCLFVHAAMAGRGDSSLFQILNTKRIHTNMDGMRVLAVWGLANMASGITGAAIAKDGEWQHFHQMNAAWGVVNLGIAVMGYIEVRRELTKPVSNLEGFYRHEAAERLYLINAGLDGLYIATGAFLTERAKTAGSDAPLYRGFGKSLIMQGAGLLLFDASMFLAHHRQGNKWHRALEGFCVTGDGVGWRWSVD